VELLAGDKKNENITDLLAERENRPKWWNGYDILSDIFVILAWASIGNYLIGILMILMKAMIVIKIPEYYIRENNEKD